MQRTESNTQTKSSDSVSRNASQIFNPDEQEQEQEQEKVAQITSDQQLLRLIKQSLMSEKVFTINGQKYTLTGKKPQQQPIQTNKPSIEDLQIQERDISIMNQKIKQGSIRQLSQQVVSQSSVQSSQQDQRNNKLGHSIDELADVFKLQAQESSTRTPGDNRKTGKFNADILDSSSQKKVKLEVEGGDKNHDDDDSVNKQLQQSFNFNAAQVPQQQEKQCNFQDVDFDQMFADLGLTPSNPQNKPTQPTPAAVQNFNKSSPNIITPPKRQTVTTLNQSSGKQNPSMFDTSIHVIDTQGNDTKQLQKPSSNGKQDHHLSYLQDMLEMPQYGVDFIRSHSFNFDSNDLRRDTHRSVRQRHEMVLSRPVLNSVSTASNTPVVSSTNYQEYRSIINRIQEIEREWSMLIQKLPPPIKKQYTFHSSSSYISQYGCNAGSPNQFSNQSSNSITYTGPNNRILSDFDNLGSSSAGVKHVLSQNALPPAQAQSFLGSPFTATASQPDLHSLSTKIDLAFLYSSPLVMNVTTRTGQVKISPMPAIDYETEFNQILTSLNQTGSSVCYRKLVSTVENFRMVMTQHPMALHFSGHGIQNNERFFPDSNLKGQGNFLVFEHGNGDANFVSEQRLAKLIKASRTKLQFVFVASCYSEFAGSVFLSAGAKHVICVRKGQQISDTAVFKFSKAFYHGIFSKNLTVCQAFQAAKQTVLGEQSECGVNQGNKFTILINDNTDESFMYDQDQQFEDGHYCRPLPVPGQGEMKQITKAQLLSKMKGKVDDFLGRSAEMHQIICHLHNYRLVTIKGVPGMGKTSLAKQVGYFLQERTTFKNGVLYQSLRGLMSTDRAISQLYLYLLNNKNQKRKVGEIKKITDLINQKEVLLILDNAQDLLQKDQEGFRQMITDLMQACQNVRLLITSRCSVGSITEVTQKIMTLKQLSRTDTATLLFRKSPRQITEHQVEELLQAHYEQAMTMGNKKGKGLLGVINREPARRLGEHPIIYLLGGHPQAISLAAPLLQDRTLLEFYQVLNSTQFFKQLQMGNGSPDNSCYSLQASLDLSLGYLKQKDPDCIELFYDLGLMPGGVSKQQLQSIWGGNNWQSQISTLMRASLLVKRVFLLNHSSRYSLLPFMCRYAQSKLSQENAKNGHQRILAYYANLCQKCFKQIGKKAQRIINNPSKSASLLLMESETNIWGCLNRQIEITAGELAHKMTFLQMYYEHVDEDAMMSHIRSLNIAARALDRPIKEGSHRYTDEDEESEECSDIQQDQRGQDEQDSQVQKKEDDKEDDNDDEEITQQQKEQDQQDQIFQRHNKFIQNKLIMNNQQGSSYNIYDDNASSFGNSGVFQNNKEFTLNQKQIQEQLEDDDNEKLLSQQSQDEKEFIGLNSLEPDQNDEMQFEASGQFLLDQRLSTISGYRKSHRQAHYSKSIKKEQSPFASIGMQSKVIKTGLHDEQDLVAGNNRRVSVLKRKKKNQISMQSDSINDSANLRYSQIMQEKQIQPRKISLKKSGFLFQKDKTDNLMLVMKPTRKSVKKVIQGNNKLKNKKEQINYPKMAQSASKSSLIFDKNQMPQQGNQGFSSKHRKNSNGISHHMPQIMPNFQVLQVFLDKRLLISTDKSLKSLKMQRRNSEFQGGISKKKYGIDHSSSQSDIQQQSSQDDFERYNQNSTSQSKNTTLQQTIQSDKKSQKLSEHSSSKNLNNSNNENTLQVQKKKAKKFRKKTEINQRGRRKSNTIHITNSTACRSKSISITGSNFHPLDIDQDVQEQQVVDQETNIQIPLKTVLQHSSTLEESQVDFLHHAESALFSQNTNQDVQHNQILSPKSGGSNSGSPNKNAKIVIKIQNEKLDDTDEDCIQMSSHANTFSVEVGNGGEVCDGSQQSQQIVSRPNLSPNLSCKNSPPSLLKKRLSQSMITQTFYPISQAEMTPQPRQDDDSISQISEQENQEEDANLPQQYTDRPDIDTESQEQVQDGDDEGDEDDDHDDEQELQSSAKKRQQSASQLKKRNKLRNKNLSIIRQQISSSSSSSASHNNNKDIIQSQRRASFRPQFNLKNKNHHNLQSQSNSSEQSYRPKQKLGQKLISNQNSPQINSSSQKIISINQNSSYNTSHPQHHLLDDQIYSRKQTDPANSLYFTSDNNESDKNFSCLGEEDVQQAEVEEEQSQEEEEQDDGEFERMTLKNENTIMSQNVESPSTISRTKKKNEKKSDNSKLQGGSSVSSQNSRRDKKQAPAAPASRQPRKPRKFQTKQTHLAANSASSVSSSTANTSHPHSKFRKSITQRFKSISKDYTVSKLRKQSVSKNPPISLSQKFSNIGKLCVYYASNLTLQEFFKDALTVIENGLKLDEVICKANLLKLRGLIKMQSEPKDPIGAKFDFQVAFNQFQKGNSYHGSAICKAALGYLYHSKLTKSDNSNKSRRYIQESLHLYEKENHESGQAYCYHILSILEKETNNKTKSKQYSEKSWQLQKKTKNTKFINRWQGRQVSQFIEVASSFKDTQGSNTNIVKAAKTKSYIPPNRISSFSSKERDSQILSSTIKGPIKTKVRSVIKPTNQTLNKSDRFNPFGKYFETVNSTSSISTNNSNYVKSNTLKRNEVRLDRQSTQKGLSRKQSRVSKEPPEQQVASITTLPSATLNRIKIDKSQSNFKPLKMKTPSMSVLGGGFDSQKANPFPHKSKNKRKVFPEIIQPIITIVEKIDKKGLKKLSPQKGEKHSSSSKDNKKVSSTKKKLTPFSSQFPDKLLSQSGKGTTSLVELQKMSTAQGQQLRKLSQTMRSQKGSKNSGSKKKEVSLSTMKTGGIKVGSSQQFQ